MAGFGEEEIKAYIGRELAEAEERSTVSLRLHPQRTDPYNKSPDFLVELEVSVPLFDGTPLKARVPILIEVEYEGGVSDGLKDLVRFVDRAVRGLDPTGPPIRIPMAIVTRDGAGVSKSLPYQLPVMVEVREVPYDTVA